VVSKLDRSGGRRRFVPRCSLQPSLRPSRKLPRRAAYSPPERPDRARRIGIALRRRLRFIAGMLFKAARKDGGERRRDDRA
jgi:hypothetical protein